MVNHNDSYSGPKSSNFAGRPPRNDEFKVYMKNVPADMSKESLEALCRRYGTVVSTHILDPKEGRNSTIGFVRFTSEEEVVSAVEGMNGTMLGEFCLVVEKAIPKDKGGGNLQRNQELEHQRRSLQNFAGTENDQPSFQRYRAQNEQPGRSFEIRDPNQGMGVRHEEAVFNPRGPGRGGGVGNPYQQPSFPGYQHQNYNQAPHRGGNIEEQMYNQPQEVGNVRQQSYNQQAGDEVNRMTSHQGVRCEEAVFNPTGPGRGVGLQDYQPSYHQPIRGGNLGQQNYMVPPVMNNQHPTIGVRGEQAIFNPRGPGRGGGVVNQSPPSHPPPGSNSYMNGFANEYPHDEEQGNPAPWMNEGQHQWTHNTRSADDLTQEISVSGRLPHTASSQDTAQIPNGDRSSYKCGETGHFARECPKQVQGERNGRGGNCFRCGEPGHFARECPNQEEDGRRGTENKVAPVTYIPPELPSNIDELFQDAPHSGLNFDKYDTIPVNVTGKEIPPAISTFEEAGILEQCALNIKKAQFTKPTPIQKHSIPIVLGGRDLMACAQTGSGKTVAYLLPVITGMIKNGHLSGGFLTGETQCPAALCLAPTRELAVQIHREVCKFSNETVVSAAVCYGGVSVEHQLGRIRKGCHFLVATPGRLLDFVSREKVSLANVRYLILDEADRMLDMGFEADVRKIVATCGMPDKIHRQTLMFSATFPDEIQRLAADFLKDNYLFVAVGTIGGSNLDISQTIISVPGDDKQEKLFDILLNSGTDRTLIFVELKRVADFLACLLSQNNFPTTSISGDRTQQEREAALRDFRSGRAPVLVATSVAARGLDIPDVKHVINFDLPQDSEEYVHRIGRTGRIGNKGKATSFFQPGKDEKLARSLVKVLSQAYQDVPEWLEQVAEEAVGSSYGPAGGKFASKDRRERDHSRMPAHDQPRMSRPTDGIGSLTTSMQQVSVQPPRQYLNGCNIAAGPMSNQDEEEWD